MTHALIFDCDGVLADTERDGHLPAFNAAFDEFGLRLAWSEAEYGERLAIAGGKERLASVLTPEFARSRGLPSAPDAVRALIANVHARKTELFEDIVRAGKLAPRPGVARLAHDVRRLGWKLAVASTSTPAAVRAVLATVVGETFAEEFAIFAGDMAPAKKPAPDIYLLALTELGVAAAGVLAVEDSRNGLLAATAAHLRCIVTLSGYTQHEVMDEAALVVSSLGEPGLEPIAVRENRMGRVVGPYITAADAVAIVTAPTRA